MIGLLAMTLAASACFTRTVVGTPPDGSADAGLQRATRIETNGIDKVDLVLAIDNSLYMGASQANLMAQFGPLVEMLTHPECVSASNPVPHACVAGNTEERAFVPARDIRVGIVSSDLGTPGASVPGCANSLNGDDGVLNPLDRGGALGAHPDPHWGAPPGFTPWDCDSVDQFPPFISFASGVTDPAAFEHDLRCSAGLWSHGCGLEQQLESVRRALISHDARDRAGNTDVNAGFLRDDAVLAILMLSDEDDGSIRDCARAVPGEPCDDATDVFQQGSTRWSSDNIALRTYMHQPGTDTDPTWSLDRYIDPMNAAAGFLALKPGHPERVVFGAITGVPLTLPTTGSGTDQRIVWDRLLGTASAAGPNDFVHRNAGPDGVSIDEISAEGPISMRQANLDVDCPEMRTMPACRGHGTTYDPLRQFCAENPVGSQTFAWPARRIVEVARRFEEAALCNGAPCRNGLVASICSNDYGASVRAFGRKIQSQLQPRCHDRAEPIVTADDASRSVRCVVRMLMPAGVTSCARFNGRESPADGAVTQRVDGVVRTICDVHQLRTQASMPGQALPDTTMTSPPVTFTDGCFYDTSSDPSDPSCQQRISFTDNAVPPVGSITTLYCAP